MVMTSSSIKVKSREYVTKSGFYVYGSHVESSGECPVTKTAETGFYLVKDVKAPSLATCNHKVTWKLVENN